MTLSEIKQELDGRRAIRIQGLLKRREESIIKFLVKFFTQWNDEHDTIFVESHEKQTEAGLRRSFGDIYQIIRYYYPGTQIKTIKNIVYQDLFEEISRFRSSYCHATKQRMFYVGDNDQETGIFDKNNKDEFGNTWKQMIEL